MSESSEYLPDIVYDAAQVGALDTRLIEELGVDEFELMQRAASAAYDELGHVWAMPGQMVVLCGPGNNGADGFLLACLARAGGWRVRVVCLVDPDSYGGAAADAVARWRETGAEIERFDDQPIHTDVIVDALLGTGVNRDVHGDFAAAIERINASGETGTGVFAVDMPSGIDAATGHVWECAVRADATTTFIGLKLGLLTGQGPAHCGVLSFSGLNAPEALYAEQPYTARRLVHRRLRTALRPRGRNVHKGDNGHVLCVGGGHGMGGSIRLCAEAALRSGAGLVSVGCHEDHAGAMSQARPELMCRALTDAADLTPLLEAADVVAIGPGLGRAHDGHDWGGALWQAALDCGRPLVVDADALNRLADHPVERTNWILTPHPGEAARLLGCATAEVVDDRVKAVQTIARRFNAVVVLKGAGSLIATPEELWLCTDGNPGMAVGGMGDLLTGVIAALIGQGLSLSEAASLGVYVHARAGDRAAQSAGQRGLLPSDLLEWIRYFVNPGRL